MTTTHTFTLEIDRLSTVDHGQLPNVVRVVSYTVWGQDAKGNRVPYYGSVKLPAPDAGDFTRFEDLTPGQVQSWTETAIGETEMSRITDQLTVQLSQDDIVNPAPKSVAPPWKQ